MNILLLDRDGTIIENIPYLNDENKVKIVEECIYPLRVLNDKGWKLSIVSNQSGIGRKLISMKEVHAVNKRVRDLLLENEIFIDYIYFCPHAPWQSCSCRKPNTRLIEKLLKRYKSIFNEPIDRVVMVGDSQSDIDAAKNAKIEGILLNKMKWLEIKEHLLNYKGS